MELILSHIEPAKISRHSQKDIWSSCLSKADSVKIATGYISADSVIELMKVVEVNSRPRIDLLIGMHYFDLFTKPQYQAVLALNDMLQSKNLGCVFLSNTRRYHGKMYSFLKTGNCFSAVVGSSNLASISGVSTALYEADCLFEDAIEVERIDTTITQLIEKLGTKFSDIEPITIFEQKNTLLENHYNVDKVTPEKYAVLLKDKTGLEFSIPTKTEAKSNLNVFFGKGRKNQKGLVMPRPWYEVELIVSKKITDDDCYPKGKIFTVVTDDMWSFKCYTNGDFSKNFRSYDDLKILGKWIKGRLELSGALQVGQPVTEKVLADYGNNKITLSATSDENVWLLSFKGK